jgi:hypothetical protein
MRGFRVCPGQDSIWRVTQRRVAMGAEAGRLVRDKTRAWEKGGAQQLRKKIL